jgi:hypothetical protein
MAGGSSVTFTGIRDISRLIKNGGDNALLTLAIGGTNYSKLLAPVAKIDGGQLRNSVNFKVYTGEKGGLNDSSGLTADKELTETLKTGEAAVGATAEYAGWVEFGTRKMAPQSYLRAGLALIAGQSPKVVKEKMDAEFKLGKLKYGQERVKF